MAERTTAGNPLYSEDEEYPPKATTENSLQTLDPTTQNSSTSSLSEAMDPDADAEGEPDDLDADADGIEDDDGIAYDDGIEDDDGMEANYEPLDRAPAEKDQDEESRIEDDEEGEEDEEDSGEEMDLDENASSPPPSPPSRQSEPALQNDTDANKKPLVLKLKLANQPVGPKNPPPANASKRKQSRKPPASKSNSNRSRLTHDKRFNTSYKRQITDEEDDELAEDSLGLDSEMDDEQGMGNHSGLYQASDDSDGASAGDDTMPGMGQLTVRQRAKEFGEPVTELQSLPMTEGKKKKDLTEADRAMEKAEKSRKRKHQNEKKLEDEKTETINRLLKGQIGKAGRNVGAKGSGGVETTEENNNQQIKPPVPPPPPTLIRSISSIRSGEYVTSLNLPASILQDQSSHSNYFLHQKSSPVYPPPHRPAPRSWKLVNGVRVN